ncbi:putative transcriptional regulator [Saccharomonospora marina XMU15]|uniref:Putative transcriptional regulator n=1 Tax=Saccharomonospora marina XMU15 TaxID=882083 RepID=H5X7U1_9PSEU|nr:ParB/RepB/Spo0J family partition protein [Saccharomonospora marina]EHR52441.1 putative transcriptional regulator [Saccharomonospora marina XMU15]
MVGPGNAPQDWASRGGGGRCGLDEELARCRPVRVAVDELLPAESLRTDGEDAGYVRTLADVEDGVPAIVVDSATKRVIDGMHRLRAAALRGQKFIDAVLFDGSREDAFVLAVCLNRAHGLPLSPEDRRKAAVRIIGSHPTWSDRAIADIAGLSSKTVGSLRRNTAGTGAVPHSRVGVDGKARPVDPAESRRRVRKVLNDLPQASLREVARRAGVSTGTVRDVRKRLASGQDPVPDRQRNAEHRPNGDTGGLRAAADPLQLHATHLENLKRDPSMRFSEAGRNLLRLLAIGTLPTAQWQRYVDSVPMHCLVTAATAARRCSEVWTSIALHLNERIRDSDTVMADVP